MGSIINIGWRRTHVEALEIRTAGLGGDSIIEFKKGLFSIGPKRVAPIAWLSHMYPEAIDAVNFFGTKAVLPEDSDVANAIGAIVSKLVIKKQLRIVPGDQGGFSLGVVIIKFPPLRERQACMDELVNHFIKKYNNRLGTHVHNVSGEIRKLFTAYQWPGNVRELAHLIEGAMNMAGQEETIGMKHFTPGLDCLESVDFTCHNAYAFHTENNDNISSIISSSETFFPGKANNSESYGIDHGTEKK